MTLFICLMLGSGILGVTKFVEKKNYDMLSCSLLYNGCGI